MEDENPLYVNIIYLRITTYDLLLDTSTRFEGNEEPYMQNNLCRSEGKILLMWDGSLVIEGWGFSESEMNCAEMRLRILRILDGLCENEGKSSVNVEWLARN